MRSTDRERGAATVVAVAMAGVLLLLGAALCVVAAIVADLRRAQSAADLAALAGAAEVARGGADGCVTAARVAVANGALLASCLVVGSEVTVSATVKGPAWRDLVAELDGHARAGPGQGARPG